MLTNSKYESMMYVCQKRGFPNYGGLIMKQKNKMIQSPKQHKNFISCDSFHGTVEFIGKRWMGIIVYRLLDGPKRYHELFAEIEGISDRLLTERLRELEKHGLLIKNVCDASSRKVTYELTDIGAELEDIINAVFKWVEKNGCHAYKG